MLVDIAGQEFKIPNEERYRAQLRTLCFRLDVLASENKTAMEDFVLIKVYGEAYPQAKRYVVRLPRQL